MLRKKINLTGMTFYYTEPSYLFENSMTKVKFVSNFKSIQNASQYCVQNKETIFLVSMLHIQYWPILHKHIRSILFPGLFHF